VPKTFGHEFELLYPSIKNLNDINATFFQSTGFGKQMFTLIDFNPTLYRKILLFYFQKIYEQLGSSVSAFDQAQFDFYFGRLTSIAQFLRRILRSSLGTVTEHARQVEIEDEIDQVDALLLACSQKPFDAMAAEYKRRVAELAGLRQFGKFIQKHPGIEHKAGVPKGGTFIIVYHEKQKEKPLREITGFNTIATAASNLTNVGDRNLVVGLGSGSPGKTGTATNRLVSLKDIDRLSDELMELGVKPSTISLLKENIVLGRATRIGLFDSRINAYADGIVVADFYLPYLCCSDCPPIHYIITEPNVVLTLSLEKNEFCSSDNTSYLFSASPAGGVITGEKVTKENDKFHFNPSTVNLGDAKEKEIVFTYTFEEKTVTFAVKIYKKPVAAFETRQGTTSNREIIFENKSQFGTLYEWDFGESTDTSDTSNKEQPGSHIYKDEGTYPVTLKVINGTCSDTITKIINIVPLGAVSINLDKIEYCSEETGSFTFIVSPTGGEVTGEGVKELSAGNFAFTPAEVALANLDNKTIVFTYTAPDGRTATFNAVVFHRPSQPKFSFERSGATNTVIFTVTSSTFAKSFRWNFGDGQTTSSASNTISHSYFQSGKFQVALEAINGNCVSEPAKAVVELEPIVVVTKTCLPLNDIIKDFTSLSKIDPNLFPGFTTTLASFGKMVDFYGQAEAVITGSKEEQLKFFVSTKVEAQLSKWLPETAVLFNSDFRTLAFSLYRVLVNTAMLVACLKGEDINAGSPAMETVFKIMLEQFALLASMGGQMNASQKKIIQVMLSDVQAELTRIEKNKEKKPRYTDVVKKLIETLKPAFP
jgi:PKD repeat protein